MIRHSPMPLRILRPDLSPESLLERLHAIEMSFGRQRQQMNAPRPLDLDLLDYDGLIQDGPPILPHPRMASRAFVLIPLADIAPNWTHPVTRQALPELLRKVKEDGIARLETSVITRG